MARLTSQFPKTPHPCLIHAPMAVPRESQSGTLTVAVGNSTGGVNVTAVKTRQRQSTPRVVIAPPGAHLGIRTDPSRPGPVRTQGVPSSQATLLTATPDPPNHGTRVSKRRLRAVWFSSVVAQGPLPVHARVQRCWSQRCKGTGRRHHSTAQTKPGWGQSVDARRLRQQGRDETNDGGRRSACDDPRWVRPRSSSAVVPTVTRHHHTPPAALAMFAAPLLSSG